MSGPDTALLEGVALLLAAEVDPSWSLAWVTTGEYATDQTGIYAFLVPAVPNRIVTLSSYGLGDDAVYADTTTGLQVRTRSAGQDPRDATDLDAAIADVLLGRYPFDLATGVHIQTAQRTSGPTSLGQDDNLRWEFSSNYSLGLHRPGTHRL